MSMHETDRPMLFDSHSHYDDEAFDEDRDALLKSLPENGIEGVVNVGSSLETVKKTIALMDEYDHVYGAIGIHPNETGGLTESHIQWLQVQCGLPKAVAVGEIGLDYYWDTPERPVQKKWFERQLQMAKEVDLPVIIHSRDAAADTLDMMKALHGGETGGVIHCFSYGKELAREYLNMGLYIGVGGVVTFKNAKKLKEVVAYAPMDRIVLETDCPYLAPVPNRGKRNSSLNLPYVAEEIAGIKGLPVEEVIRITTENTKALYHLR